MKKLVGLMLILYIGYGTYSSHATRLSYQDQILVASLMGLVQPTLQIEREKSMAVMLVNFENKPDQPFSPDFAKKLVFHDFNRALESNGFSATQFQGHVHGWVTLPINLDNCKSDYTKILPAALDKANEIGLNPDRYDYFLMIFPGSDQCGFVGRGQGKWLLLNEPLNYAI